MTYSIILKFTISCITKIFMLKHDTMNVYNKRQSATYSQPWHWTQVSGQLHVMAAFIPMKWSPSALWLGSWVVPKPVWDMLAKRKTNCTYQKSNPSHPVYSLSLYWLNIMATFVDQWKIRYSGTKIYFILVFSYPVLIYSKISLFIRWRWYRCFIWIHGQITRF